MVELCDCEVLLQREQHYLDILFSLPANLRYNFSPVAGAPIAGRTHSPETLAKMSDSQQLVDRSGANNPMFGITHTPETRAQMSDSQRLVDRSGANHPMYGKVPNHAMTVNVYSIDKVLVHSFSSQVAVAKWFGI